MKYLGPPQSGSVANETFSRNRFGQYVRTRVGRGGVPSRSISLAVAAWQALSADQQIAWGVWSETILRPGSLGSVRALHGWQRFVSAWMFAHYMFGVTPLTDPPVERSPVDLLSVSASMVGAVLTVDTATIGAGFYEWQRVFPYASAGTLSPPGRDAYWLSGVAAATAGTQTDVLNTGVTPPSGSRMFVRARGVGSDFVPGPWILAPLVQL